MNGQYVVYLSPTEDAKREKNEGTNGKLLIEGGLLTFKNSEGKVLISSRSFKIKAIGGEEDDDGMVFKGYFIHKNQTWVFSLHFWRN